MSASTLLHSLFKYKAWANEELFAELAKVDEAAHQTERHTALRLLNHLHVVDRLFAAHLSGDAHSDSGTNTAETPTLDELRSAVARSDRWYLDYLETLPAARLPEKLPFTFTDGAHGSMSREEMLAHVATHSSYHRGAVGRLLAQASVAPPRDIFTVYLHQSEPRRRKRP